MTETDPDPDAPAELPLAGYTVAVTAARRKEELGALLDRRGARVVYAPAIRIVPLSDDTELVAATREVLSKPVDLVVATTGRGLPRLAGGRRRLGPAAGRAPARPRGCWPAGPRRAARSAAAGWSTPGRRSRSRRPRCSSHLLSGAEGPLEGRRIAVQLHGDPLPDLVTGLRRTGAEVLTVPVYRWVLPEDVAPVHRLVASVIAGGVDAVTFTSAPAAASLLAVADEVGTARGAGRRAAGAGAGGRGRPGDRRPARRGRHPVLPARARPPRRAGPRGRRPAARARPGAGVGAHTLQVRGHAAVVDGRVVELAPGPMAVLRALACTPGPRRPPGRPDRLAARRRGRARGRDGGDPAARRARRPGRRDGREARLPPQV